MNDNADLHLSLGGHAGRQPHHLQLLPLPGASNLGLEGEHVGKLLPGKNKVKYNQLNTGVVANLLDLDTSQQMSQPTC